MNCSVCGAQQDGRFCVDCCNDVRNPVNTSLEAVVALRRAFAAVKQHDYFGGVREFRTASHLGYTLPSAMEVMMWFQLALHICKASTGGSLLKMPTPVLMEYIQTLETGQRLVPRLPFDVAEVKDNFASWFQQFLRVAYKTLEARNEPPAPNIVGKPNGDNYTFANPMGAERLQVGSIGIRCVRCPNHVIPIQLCSNCSGGLFVFGVDVLKVTGLFCLACHHVYTSIKCVCGCQNPIQVDTIMRPKRR